MSAARTIATALSLLSLAGCVSAGSQAYSDTDAAFLPVSAAAAGATGGKQTVWIANSVQAGEIAQRVSSLVRGKTIAADTAVQVALLNNRGLQAAYAEIGISAAEAWQQSLPENPKVSIGLMGIASPEAGLFRAIESVVAANILSLATREKRVAIADTRFRQAQLQAVEETLRTAVQTRRAWIDAVAAFERVYFLNQARAAADAASELAERLGETGAMTKAAQAREHAFHAELAGQTAEARLAAALAKERLARQMGLWGDDLDFFVPDQLPQLPARLAEKRAIEAEALRSRADLMVARLELEAVALEHGLTQATRYVTDFELLAGFETEKETETEYELVPGPALEEKEKRKAETTGLLEIEFTIPIFDSGEARLRKAEFAYMRAANLLAQKAVEVRSHAREAHKAWQGAWQIARHYRNAVVPLRTKVEEEALLTYNGMITSTFDLLAETRARIDTVLLSANAKKEFWLADANVAAAIHGGGAEAPAAGPAPSMAAKAPAGH